MGYNPNRPSQRIRYSIAHEIAHTFFRDCAERVRHRAPAGHSVSVEGPQGVGIYLMKPDGSGRKWIPIAKGEFPRVQPEFFPEGSCSESRVIYQTEKNPRFNF